MDDYDVTQLIVAGYDAPVPNEYWSTGSDTLMVMLPGFGYTNQMPLMFYVQELALHRKWDVLQVNYDYRGITGTMEEERLVRMASDCRAAVDAALTEGEYGRAVLAGKSLGTIAMMTLLQSGGAHVAAFLRLTPILAWPEVRDTIFGVAADSAVVIGTRDKHYDASLLETFRDQGATVKVVDGGDHSLDVAGGVVESVGMMREVVAALDGFLTAAVS